MDVCMLASFLMNAIIIYTYHRSITGFHVFSLKRTVPFFHLPLYFMNFSPISRYISSVHFGLGWYLLVEEIAVVLTVMCFIFFLAVIALYCWVIQLSMFENLEVYSECNMIGFRVFSELFCYSVSVYYNYSMIVYPLLVEG